MKVRKGKCKGGPWDGQMFAHYADSKEFFEPHLRLVGWMIDPEIVAAKIGEYYWGANGLWIWLPEGTRSKRTRQMTHALEE